jgi:hypothetical protein
VTEPGAGGWSDEVDEILASDLTAALAYVTPAGGTVLTAVAPVGLRDRAAGTVTFTTSEGFGRKLDRIKRNPKVALAYHAREHGRSGSSRYVLVQGDAVARPHDVAALEAIAPNVERFLGERKRGRLFWDRWLSAYYRDRLLVDVTIKRILSWPALTCEGEPAVHGASLPAGLGPPQAEPTGGVGPRVATARAAARLAKLDHLLVAVTGADGYPLALPISIEHISEDGLHLQIAGLPPGEGGRRAGLLGHSYKAKLIGIAARQHTGWLTPGADGHALYAPHTEQGFNAPANKTILLLANGYLARQGLRRARAHGTG